MPRLGRPSQPGPRYKGGRRKPPPQARVEPNTKALALQARFARFQQGKAGQQAHDPIGRAWAVGLLENAFVDPASLRDAGRQYGEAYWAYWGGGARVANYEGGCNKGSDRDDWWFTGTDARLESAGRVAYDAVQALVVDGHWSPDADPDWLERLVNLAMIGVREPVVGRLPIAGDREMMHAAVRGLLALTGEM